MGIVWNRPQHRPDKMPFQKQTAALPDAVSHDERDFPPAHLQMVFMRKIRVFPHIPHDSISIQSPTHIFPFFC